MRGQASCTLTGSIQGWLLAQVRSIPAVSAELGDEQALAMVDYLREQIHRLAVSRQLTSNQAIQLLVRLAAHEARLLRLGHGSGYSAATYAQEALPN